MNSREKSGAGAAAGMGATVGTGDVDDGPGVIFPAPRARALSHGFQRRLVKRSSWRPSSVRSA
jgi:hypothetical protein